MITDNEVILRRMGSLWKKAVSEILTAIYQYNSLIKGTGYYLKPMHVVVKRSSKGRIEYIYYGRYWWEVKYIGKKGKTSRVKWLYRGNIKPRGLPEPPLNPLTGISVRIEADDLIFDRQVFEEHRDFILSILCKQ